MKKNQFQGKLLSKEQQKSVKGGIGGDCSYRLCCTTPNGTECWNRSSMNGGAGSVCQGIYPAYGGNVSGVWEETCFQIMEDLPVA